MSANNSKGKQNKKTNNSQNDKKANSEILQNPQIMDKEQSDSKALSCVSIYIKAEENINKLKEIKNNLKIDQGYMEKFNSILKALEEEKEEINGIYANEDEINKAIENKNVALKLDNEIFESRAKKIFSEVYGLKEKILYPYFSVEYSRNKRTNTIKIYYYNVEIQINGENSTSFVFLDDKDAYLAYFEGIPLLFQKEKGIFNNMAVIAKDFKNCSDFQIIKENQVFKTSFIYADICNELLEIKGKMNEMKNKIDSLVDIDTNKEEKENLEKLLKLYEEKYSLMKKKYSKERLETELAQKKEELELLDLNIKLREVDDINNAKRNSIKAEIEKYNNLLRLITINIKKKDQEFDGLFISNKTINLENSLDDQLKIPPKRPIIVEVKNHCKYSDIISNLRKKKKILESIGFQKDCFFFVGILRGLNLNDQIKEEIKLIKANSDLTNMIVIYPDNTKFLNVPLYDIKEGAKEVNLKQGPTNDLMQALIEIIDKKLDEKLDNLKITLKRELKDEIISLIKK